MATHQEVLARKITVSAWMQFLPTAKVDQIQTRSDYEKHKP